MTDGSDHQGDIFAVLLPRHGTKFHRAGQTVVRTRNNFGFTRGPAGGSHVGHLSGMGFSTFDFKQFLSRNRPFGH